MLKTPLMRYVACILASVAVLFAMPYLTSLADEDSSAVGGPSTQPVNETQPQVLARLTGQAEMVFTATVESCKPVGEAGTIPARKIWEATLASPTMLKGEKPKNLTITANLTEGSRQIVLAKNAAGGKGLEVLMVAEANDANVKAVSDALGVAATGTSSAPATEPASGPAAGPATTQPAELVFTATVATVNNMGFTPDTKQWNYWLTFKNFSLAKGKEPNAEAAFLYSTLTEEDPALNVGTKVAVGAAVLPKSGPNKWQIVSLKTVPEAASAPAKAADKR